MNKEKIEFEFKLKMDKNGNKVCSVKSDFMDRSFSIQTNENMPITHRNGIGYWTEREMLIHVAASGTNLQKKRCGVEKGYIHEEIPSIKALKAIKARIDGDIDNTYLAITGIISSDPLSDIKRLVKLALIREGLIK